MTAYDGLDAAALERLTGAPLVVLEESVSSTQDVVHRLGSEGAPSGAVALAEEQTAGRGRQGRAWHSPGGRGVWLSVLLRPPHSPLGGVLAVRAGLAALSAIREAAPRAAVRLRWPNDLVVADRKVGGILCEARWSGEVVAWAAVGVGINVAGPVAPAVRDSAIALADVAPGVSRLALVTALVHRLRALDPLPPELTADERDAFLRAEWRAPDAPETADLAADGALVVRTATGALDRREAAP